MHISPATRTYIETRAIALLGEPGRETFLSPSPELIKTIADKLAPYATELAGYGKPPTMEKEWLAVSDDTGARTGQVNMDMMDIAAIYESAVQYVAASDDKLIEKIQSKRIMLRSQAIYPQLRKLGEAAAVAVAKPDFKKGGFTPSV